MTYTKFHSAWHDFPTTDTPITAAALDHIEDGIEAAAVPVGCVDPREFGASTDSSDNTAAFQAAFDYAMGTADAGQGTVIIPPGVWKFTGQLLYNANVDIVGFGENTSILHWTTNTNPGSGTYARFCMNFSGSGYGGSITSWRHFQIKGPDAAQSATGNVCGPRLWGVSFTLQNVLVNIFKYGLCNGGDHNTFHKVDTTNCYGGLLIPGPRLTGGDNRYYSCNFSGDLAGMVIEGDGISQGDVFVGCGFHGAIGIYQDDASYNGVPLAYNAYINCSFENCGNGVIYCENGASSSHSNAGITALQFIRCALLLTAANNPAYPGDSNLFTAYAFFHCEFSDINGGNPAADSWFVCWKFSNNTIASINQLGAAGPAIVMRPDGPGDPAALFFNNRVEHLGYGKGRIEWFTETAAAGDVQEWQPWDEGKGVRKARTGSKVPLGVAVRAETAGTAGLLQTSGYINGVSQDATASTGALAAVSGTTAGTMKRTDLHDGSAGTIIGYWGNATSGQTVVYLTLPD